MKNEKETVTNNNKLLLDEIEEERKEELLVMAKASVDNWLGDPQVQKNLTRLSFNDAQVHAVRLLMELTYFDGLLDGTDSVTIAVIENAVEATNDNTKTR